MTQKAFTYLRVSGDDQVDRGGFPRQRASCQKYASLNGIEIVQEFRDEGVTGKMELENREGLSALIAAVQEQQIPLVLVEDSTRLARDLIVAEVCIREFQRLGVHVIAASGGIDLTDGNDANPTAKLVRQILAAISEFDRCCTVIRLRAGRERKKATKGRCEGRKGYGEKPGESTTLSMIKLANQDGQTPSEIADWLNNRLQVPSRYGKKWHAATVAKIIKRINSQRVGQPTCEAVP